MGVGDETAVVSQVAGSVPRQSPENQGNDIEAELDMDWIHPWIGLD